ncbi:MULTISPECIES: SRPBCC domain-containing protein [unclassified Bosea (in: a-proteobacteria)]|uniref:SRPBCC family protein n=1 Tax=unclassified Bosea (in: a-proteobacteria) TaxID=2653178 RepID=UPI00125C44F8|nr:MULTISPECIES: SRPBCC domain-containing protein [unclassified Bosea (in: a-proteobacteria)]CAD5267143.1 Polyketide cyclase [Bosea sp. 46]CAD5268834.1 Polyketide cyclase [Bosea sp. 21B]CAD5269817.1 Polyketide cyclase [Bosea sp. 7B]VVT62456.1 Polyketide cyclase [Bosea sp. EC-HK365B]VXB93783.1 Polyketide cyclase [Bosea sp. 29B]
MSESDIQDRAKQLVFEYQLDAPPEKVWRALSIPAFRERWLPAEVEALSTVPGEEVRYRLREEEPPFLESVVTFQLAPNEGGTELRIIHSLTDARLSQPPAPANSNQPLMLRAA